MNQPTDADFTYRAPPPITTPDDPRRLVAAVQLEAIEMILASIETRFAPGTLAFHALRLAWEVTRLAWYAVDHESDGDHLGDVRAALGVVEEKLKGMER